MILIADSGSTKTDWCLADGERVMSDVTTQGINPFHQSEEQINLILDEELLPKLDCAAVRSIFFYGSGCREECIPIMERALGRVFPRCTQVEIHGDLLGAARALCGTGEGIACIIGTGSNSCLYDGNGIVDNTPPLGYILGDEGSGAVLGRLFVNALFKGLLPDRLRDVFHEETGLTVADVIDRVYRASLPHRFLSAFAPLIHRNLDDPAVRALVIDNFRSFFSRNVLRYGRRDLPVNAVGSIAHYFSSEFAEAARVEGFVIGRIERSPISGLVRYHSLHSFC